MTLAFTENTDFGGEDIKIQGCWLSISQSDSGEWSCFWSDGPLARWTGSMGKGASRGLTFKTRAEAIAQALVELREWLNSIRELETVLTRAVGEVTRQADETVSDFALRAVAATKIGQHVQFIKGDGAPQDVILCRWCALGTRDDVMGAHIHDAVACDNCGE